MRLKKAQVAAEFLATYGWALFGIFILLAILVGTGLINPGRFIGEECTAQPGFSCTGYYLKSTGPSSLELGAKLTNLLGYPVYIKNVSVAYGRAYPCTSVACGAANYSAPSESDVIRVQMAPVNRVPDQITPFYMTLYYRNCQDFNTSEQCANAQPDLYPYHRTTVRLYLNTRHG